MSDLLDIPPNLDRRANGRCRAFYMAHDNSPGHLNPYEYAEKNYTKFLEKAIELDNKLGPLKACRPQPYDKELLPIRKRTRNVKKEKELGK